MRILYYFPEKSNTMMQWQRVHFFDELLHYGIAIHVFNPLLYRNIEEAQEMVLKELNKVSYDLFMTCLCNEKHIYRSTIESIKRKGIPTLSFRPDNLAIPFNDKLLSPVFDLLWLTSKETQYLYKKWGANTIYAPYAANPFVFTYTQNSMKKGLCFIGNPHGSRARIINILTEHTVPVEMYFGKKENSQEKDNGIEPLWNLPTLESRSVVMNRLLFREGRRLLRGALMEKFCGSNSIVKDNDYLHRYSSLSFVDMVKAYSNYYMSLSFSSYAKTDCLTKNLPVLNLRNFEIPMCGGIQLCRYSEEMSSYFEDGKEVVLYHNEEEMCDKAKYYLNDASETEIQRMKVSARHRAEEQHTWMCRFKIIFDVLGLKF